MYAYVYIYIVKALEGFAGVWCARIRTTSPTAGAGFRP